MLEFSVEKQKIENVPILRIKGEIDIYTCKQLRTVLDETVGGVSDVLLLNLEHVQYIDSTGLGTIAHTAHALSKQGGKIHIVCSKPQVKKIFDVSGLSKKNIHLFDGEESALAST